MSEDKKSGFPCTMNEWADFWRYTIGVNVIPADTRNKRPIVGWKPYQDKPVPLEVHEHWKWNKMFEGGMDIIPGKIWHVKDKKELYLIAIDWDERRAIDEFIKICGKANSLERLSEKFIVEQHKDSPSRGHLYFYSPIPFPKKGSDAGLALEIKGSGDAGVMCCTDSVHKNDYRYVILGTLNPITLTSDEAQRLITDLTATCSAYKRKHIAGEGRTVDKFRTTIKTLTLDESKSIAEGERHSTLISIANSLIHRHLICDRKPQGIIQNFLSEINQRLCKPEPLPDYEIQSIWKSAMSYMFTCAQKGQITVQTHCTEESKGEDIVIAPDIPDRDYAEFTVRTIKKVVKREDVLVRQIFYTGLSTYTFDPINLGIIAPTSEGKTYVVTRALKPFPEEDVWNIGNMSTKVLVRQKGILVGPDGKPIREQVNELKKRIRALGSAKKDAEEKQALIEELDELVENAKTEIDLSGKILVFLEPPHRELWNLVKPILSHDLVKIDFPYVDRTDRDGISNQESSREGLACLHIL